MPPTDHAPHDVPWRRVLMAMVGAFLAHDALLAQPATPPGAETTTRLIRSTSGSRGLQRGNTYAIEDPRSVFSLAEDRQVVVFFEWEGRPGTLRCEARWKDPSGKVVLVSPLEYQATARRFGVYWTLALAETAPQGLWAVEALVNGQPAGTHTFEVKASASVAPGRRVLAPAEIYKLALASVGTVEALGSSGETLRQGPAVTLDGDHLVAAFSLIDGAAKLRLRAAPERRLETQEVAARHRRQGWAVLRFPGHGLSALSRTGGSSAVGDRYLVLDSNEQGDRIITEAGVVGQEQSSVRLRLNNGFAAGSPVLDERGDLAGIVVGGGVEDTLGPTGMVLALSGPAQVARGALLLPVSALPVATTGAVTLADLASRGEFLRPLSAGERNVISGVFAARVERGGAVPMPLDQRFVFSHRDREFNVFIQWNPVEKKDALGWFEVYDFDNRMVVKGEPTKFKLRQGQLFFTTVTFPIERLPPAVYRVELVLEPAPIWRGYVRITE